MKLTKIPDKELADLMKRDTNIIVINRNSSFLDNKACNIMPFMVKDFVEHYSHKSFNRYYMVAVTYEDEVYWSGHGVDKNGQGISLPELANMLVGFLNYDTIASDKKLEKVKQKEVDMYNEGFNEGFIAGENEGFITGYDKGYTDKENELFEEFDLDDDDEFGTDDKKGNK